MEFLVFVVIAVYNMNRYNEKLMKWWFLFHLEIPVSSLPTAIL
jgi:hypothetical protein